MRRTYGYTKQGIGYGYNKVKGLNALLAIAITFYNHSVVAAVLAAGARFSITTRMDLGDHRRSGPTPTRICTSKIGSYISLTAKRHDPREQRQSLQH